jgi:hypothetical protein
MYKRYLSHVSDHQLVSTISLDEFTSLVNSPCVYCGTPPETIQEKLPLMFKSKQPINGIDRLDTSLGYVQGNVVSCCRICNMMRRNLPIDIFLSHIEKIHSFQSGQSAAKLEELLSSRRFNDYPEREYA